MVLIALEAVPVGNKPSAADGSMRTLTGERWGFGASAPSLARAPSIHFSVSIKRGSAIMMKLVKLVGPSLILAKELSPFITGYAATTSVRLLVFLSVFTSASVARRGCRASCCRSVKR